MNVNWFNRICEKINNITTIIKTINGKKFCNYEEDVNLRKTILCESNITYECMCGLICTVPCNNFITNYQFQNQHIICPKQHSIDWNYYIINESNEQGAVVNEIKKKNKKISRDSVIKGICYCGEPFERSLRNCVTVGGSSNVGFYCRDCTNKFREKKKKKTSREKYGCDYPTQCSEVKKKTQRTCIDKWGQKTNLLHNETKQKSEDTCLEKYGVKTPQEASQLSQIKYKREQTNLRKHGVKNIFEDKDYIKQCNIDKTGYEYHTQRQEIKAKIKETNIKKRGRPCTLQDPEVDKKTKKTMNEKYGCDYPSQRPEHKQKLRELKLSNTAEFIQKANKKHNNRYTYDNVEYNRAIKPVMITCKKHGDFPQTPNTHLTGSGCPRCAIIESASKRKLSKQISNEIFIQNANVKHNNRYEYRNLPPFIRIHNTKITITCKKHGDFPQLAANHLYGKGCSKCAIDERALLRRKTLEQFIKESNKKHNNLYTYDNVDYKNTETHVMITCKKHGDFPQTPSHHIRGDGCPKCPLKTESKFNEWLLLNKKELKIKNIYWKQKENRPEWASFRKPPHNGSYYEYDFIIITENDEKNIIELDGAQHYKQVDNWTSVLFNQIRDEIKQRLAFNNDYNFIRLNQEDVFENKNNWQGEIKMFFEEIQKKPKDDIIYINSSHGERYENNTGDYRHYRYTGEGKPPECRVQGMLEGEGEGEGEAR